jgi:hypothetical protein
MLEYVVRLVRATRDDRRLRLGASPRSAQSLLAAAKARPRCWSVATFVTPDEVKAVAPSVLNHRLIVRAEAEVEGITSEDVIAQLLERVEVPTMIGRPSSHAARLRRRRGWGCCRRCLAVLAPRSLLAVHRARRVLAAGGAVDFFAPRKVEISTSPDVAPVLSSHRPTRVQLLIESDPRLGLVRGLVQTSPLSDRRRPHRTAVTSRGADDHRVPARSP